MTTPADLSLRSARAHSLAHGLEISVTVSLQLEMLLTLEKISNTLEGMNLKLEQLVELSGRPLVNVVPGPATAKGFL